VSSRTECAAAQPATSAVRRRSLPSARMPCGRVPRRGRCISAHRLPGARARPVRVPVTPESSRPGGPPRHAVAGHGRGARRHHRNVRVAAGHLRKQRATTYVRRGGKLSRRVPSSSWPAPGRGAFASASSASIAPNSLSTAKLNATRARGRPPGIPLALSSRFRASRNVC
jgi:hypothetical protein